MKITMDVHTATYAPWEEGADERERIGESSETLTFDNARECADWLERQGLQSVSSTGPYWSRTWLSELDPYEDAEGVLTERSAHAEAVDSRVWAAIVHTVSRAFSGYVGPYYVERRNDFGVRV
jgi:hypothetical protein